MKPPVLPYSEGQQEALIACHYNLAVAEQGLGHTKEALSWIRLAEEEQDKLGQNGASRNHCCSSEA